MKTKTYQVQAFSKVDGWQTLESFQTASEAGNRLNEIEKVEPKYKGKLRLDTTEFLICEGCGRDNATT